MLRHNRFEWIAHVGFINPGTRFECPVLELTTTGDQPIENWLYSSIGFNSKKQAERWANAWFKMNGGSDVEA